MQPRPQATALFPGLEGGAGKKRPGDEVEGHVQGLVTMKQTKFALRSLLLALRPSCRIVENLKKGSRKGALRDSARVAAKETRQKRKPANRGRNSTNHKPQKRDTMRMRS